jgi:hypothetical protein
MKLLIEIDLDNAAFEKDNGVDEVERILTKLMDRDYPTIPQPSGWTCNLRDINGNTVGKARIQ